MRNIIFCTLLLQLLLAASPARGESSSYLAIKGGGFLPNGAQLSDFDTGYNVDLAVGIKPAPYAAIELGTGYYSASRNRNENSLDTKSTITGIPATLTVKGIITHNGVDLFAAAGGGYYFGVLTQRKSDTVTGIVEKRNSHGNDLGYHVGGGFDINMGRHWSVGAEIRWFTTRQRLNIDPVTLSTVTPAGNKKSWELGGTNFDLGVKYRF